MRIRRIAPVLVLITCIATTGSQLMVVHAVPNTVYILGESEMNTLYLIASLREAGFASITTGSGTTLDSIGILVVFQGSYFSWYRSSQVLDFVSRGGGLLLTAGSGQIGAINTVSTNFGVTYLSDSGMHDSDSSNYAVNSYGNATGLLVQDFSVHPITEGVSRLALWGYDTYSEGVGTPVMRVNQGQVIARLSSTAYSTDGTFAVGSRPPAVAVDLYGNGRVVAIASDFMIAKYDNVKLFVNSISWLAEPWSQTQQQTSVEPMIGLGILVDASIITSVVGLVIGYAIFRFRSRTSRHLNRTEVTTTFCRVCGNKLAPTDRFCNQCGTAAT